MKTANAVDQNKKKLFILFHFQKVVPIKQYKKIL